MVCCSERFSPHHPIFLRVNAPWVLFILFCINSSFFIVFYLSILSDSAIHILYFPSSKPGHEHNLVLIDHQTESLQSSYHLLSSHPRAGDIICWGLVQNESVELVRSKESSQPPLLMGLPLDLALWPSRGWGPSGKRVILWSGSS